MKTAKFIGLATGAIVLAGWSAAAFAEHNAYCEMVSHGDKVKKATGHCNYEYDGERVHIRLVNGDTYTLMRKDKKHKYRDQKGKNVNQTIRQKEKSHYYKWESKNITVFPENWN